MVSTGVSKGVKFCTEGRTDSVVVDASHARRACGEKAQGEVTRQGQWEIAGSTLSIADCTCWIRLALEVKVEENGR